MSNKLYLTAGLIQVILLFTSCDKGSKISHIQSRNFRTENSFCEYLLIENNESKFDTLSYFYLNFDNDSLSLFTGEFLEYKVDKETKNQEISWNVTHFLGKRINNLQISKKLKLNDSFKTGKCLPENRIGNESGITFRPVIPKAMEDIFVDEEKLYYIHSWLLKHKKIDSGKQLFLVQTVSTKNGHSVNVFTIK